MIRFAFRLFIAWMPMAARVPRIVATAVAISAIRSVI